MAGYVGAHVSKETRRAKLDRLAASIPKHEFEFLMKIAKLSRHDLLGLIAKHDGGRDKVYRDLAAHLAATEAAPEPVHEAAADDGQTAGASPATNSPAGK
ncbi:hypothetical protein X731_18700 [Mesorhizobium sp. L2C054A000]|nr:hypothetical protein X731_18700 [Mesorhizobium sp. L2C054A000]